MIVYTYTRGPLKQILINADLENPATFAAYMKLMPKRVNLVYSDPPWNPGNATYWRTHAGEAPCPSYDKFLDAWGRVVAECISRGADNVFTEQSVNPKHQAMLHAAIARNPAWILPLRQTWTVFYGSPGSASVRRPNSLLQFCAPQAPSLLTDPSNMAGEPMTTRVCAGIQGMRPGDWVCDPCMGKGMTSRQAHYFEWNCIGSEINASRLAVTRKWLAGQGYAESSVEM